MRLLQQIPSLHQAKPIITSCNDKNNNNNSNGINYNNFKNRNNDNNNNKNNKIRNTKKRIIALM